jgi:hypothetical protein
MLPLDPDLRHRLLVYGLPLIAIVVLVAVITIVVDVGPLSDERLTETEFLAQGDQICEEARAAFAERQQVPPRTANEAADLAESLLGISRQELEAIDELAEPDDLSGALDEYLAAREEGIATIRKGMEAARAGDAQGYADAQAEVAEGQARRAKLAQAVGFSECSKPLTPPGPEGAGSAPPE